MQLSIVIPTYNYAHLLERAIDSVMRQAEGDWEVLVIDDGSTDATSELIDKLKLKYTQSTNIGFKQHDNIGPAGTRNRGISATKGDYLIFLDADDELCEGAIAKICAKIRDKKAINFWLGENISVSAQGVEKTHTPGQLTASAFENIENYLLEKKLRMTNGSTVMHRSIFAQYKYPERYRSAEDISVFVHTLANFSGDLLGFPVAKIHKHADSLRHQLGSALDVGEDLVDEVFCAERLPETIYSLRKRFRQQRLLSLSRTCYEAKDYINCQRYYKKALDDNILVVTNWSYLKRFLKSIVK